MTFNHVVGSLPLSLFGDGVNASLKTILAGESYSGLIKCPSKDILIFVMIAIGLLRREACKSTRNKTD